PTYSPTQASVLKEYALLQRRVQGINEQIQTLNAAELPALMDTLRTVERQSALVFTLIQSSVYSLIAEQE
ncbi:DASH complex subunit Dad3, partial [Dimargaris cristalligena]